MVLRFLPEVAGDVSAGYRVVPAGFEAMFRLERVTRAWL
jgi:hypothetical protein